MMKPNRERTQASLPPKKRDLRLVSSQTVEAAHESRGTGRDESNFVQTVGFAGSSTREDAGEVSTRGKPCVRMERIDGVVMPGDWNGMLYNLAVLSGSFSDPNVHQSHISPVNTVPAPLFQNPGIFSPAIGPYPMLPSTLQFQTPSSISTYMAFPDLVSRLLTSPQSSIPHPHYTSHFMPFPLPIQEGMVAASPWPLLYSFDRMQAAGSVPILFPPELIPQQPQAFMGNWGMFLPNNMERPQKKKNKRVYRKKERPSPGQQYSSGPEVHQMVRWGHPDAFYHPLNSSHMPHQCGAKDSQLSGQAVYDARAAAPAQLPTGLDFTHFHPDNQSSQQFYTGRFVEADGQRSSEFSGENSEALETLAERPAVQPVTRQPSPVQSQPRPVPSLGQETPIVFTMAPHFTKGSIIQLATGELKCIEDLQTEDFLKNAGHSGFQKVDPSTIVDIRENPEQPDLIALDFSVGQHQSKVTIYVPPEFPFFILNQGWSSCSPRRTTELYGLPCHHLQTGNVCVSIALTELSQGQP